MKRGRPKKTSIWEKAPRKGVDLTLTGSNVFADEVVRKRLPPETFETYRVWCDREMDALKKGRTREQAAAYANKETSKHFGRNVQTVRNRLRALKTALAEIRKWQDAEVFPKMRQYNEDLRRVRAAGVILRDPAYADIQRAELASQPAADFFSPYLAAFLEAKAANPDSPQRLASVLAAAFLRAHEARVAAEQRAEAAEKQLKPLKQKYVADMATGGAYSSSAKRK